MNLALIEAKNATKRDEVPIGALITNRNTGEILIIDSNRTIQHHNPCSHAEILVIQQACKQLGAQRIPDCNLYVTLEPCPMCAAAASFARIDTIIFGATDTKSGAVISGPKLFTSPVIHHKPSVISGIMAKECGQILKDFFKTKRM